MIIFFEGLPGAGKTSVANVLSKTPGNFLVVPEIIYKKRFPKYHNSKNQRYFFENDENKLERAIKISQEGKVAIVDRSPLSTYTFNYTKSILNNEPVSENVEKWFEKTWLKLTKVNVVIFYLKVSPKIGMLRKNRTVDHKEPWSNLKGLRLTRNLYENFIKKYPDIFIEIDTNDKSVNNVVEAAKIRLPVYQNKRNVAVFFSAHDGITSLYTGVGKIANQSLSVLSSLSLKYRFDTYFITGKYNHRCLGYDSKLKAKSKKTAIKGGGKLIEISNGSNGEISYGNINHWKTASKEAAKEILKYASKYQKIISIALDTPFAGTSESLISYNNINNIWIPHSTVALHKIDSALGKKGEGDKYYKERYLWEKRAIMMSTEKDRQHVGIISNFMETHLIREYGLKSPKIIPFKNGLIIKRQTKPSAREITKLLEKYQIDKNKNVVLTFGRLEPYKGFEDAARIAKYLPESIQMIIFAQPYKKSDAYLTSFKSFIEKIESPAKFISDYNFQDPQMIIYHKKCKVVLVPSIVEPFGLIPEEVRLKKLNHVIPVVTKIGGLEEQVTNGVDGYFIDSTSHKSSAKIISSIFRLTKQQLRELSKNGFERLKKDYDLHQNLENSLQQVLKL